MRLTLALITVLYSTAVMAQGTAPAATAPGATAPAAAPPSTQSSPPPTIGGKKLVQVKPRTGAKLSIAARLQACLDIDDGTKERLNCYDAVFAPKPNPKAKPATRVADCRFTKEEDERLACYNGFAEKIPKF
ncbi:MAG TPA: hypothetical protein VHB49_10070 [Bradyrhizobium sp.]|nr:hypothetical protein [Bradyrhizobium sp.]